MKELIKKEEKDDESEQKLEDIINNLIDKYNFVENDKFILLQKFKELQAIKLLRERHPEK